MSRYGPANSNWKGGLHSNWVDAADKLTFQIPIARSLLLRILTTRCDAAGNLPFTTQEQQWALRICREKPEWARPTLESVGIKCDE